MTTFDAAQAAYDADVPGYLEEELTDEDDDLCDRCGDQGICPECNPRRPWEE